MANITITQDRHPFTGRLEPYSGAGLSAYKLASGHSAANNFTIAAVSPRPDSETGAYSGTVNARHRWAYYDGANSVQYEVPVKILGGSAPHIFELLRAPTGATIGNNLTAADHGVVKWTPTSAYSTSSPAVFTVRVYGNDWEGRTIPLAGIDYIEITWTVATSSSTSQFLFIDNNAGNDTTGTGSISAPFATLAKVTGSTVAATTYPNRIVYLRGSVTAYQTSPHSDHAPKSAATPPQTNIYICVLDAAKKPNVFLSFPNENVTIDFTNSELRINDNDFLLSGSTTAQLRLTGSAVNTYESHNIWLTQVKRTGFSWLTIDGFIPRNAYAPSLLYETNFSPIFAPFSAADENAAKARQYGYFHGVSEINRTVANANDGLMHVMFSSHSWVEDYCIAVRSTFAANAACVHWKDGNWSTSVRYCEFGSTNSGYDFGFSFSDQSSGGNNEIVFSKVRGPICLNFQNVTTVGKIGAHVVDRCSVASSNTNGQTGRNKAVRANANAGATFTVRNSALMAINSPLYDNTVGVTSTGNECHAINSSGDLPLDTTTMLLKNSTTQYRTLYLGTRGAEIA